MALESFNAYHSYLKSIEPLNYAERGRLFTALLTYSSTGEEPELQGNERFVFPMIREQIDRDKAKYRARCEANQRNAAMRWHANGCETMPSDANHAKEKEEEEEKDKDKDKNIHSLTLSCACACEEPVDRDRVKMRFMQGELGKGVVLLNEVQIDDLLERLSIEEFDHYISAVAEAELSGKRYRKKTHYQAILDMAEKDRGIKR